MLFKELYSQFRGDIRSYTADPVITPRWFMGIAVEAINEMQDRTGYVKRTDTLFVPSGKGTLANPIDYSPYEKHIESVYDDTGSVQYGITEFQQFKAIIAAMFPANDQTQRQIPPPRAQKFNSPYTAWVSFFNRQVYVLPSPTYNLTLTIQYQPRYPQFSVDEPFWNGWGIGNTNDTAFNSQFTTVSIWRELNDYTRAIVLKCDARYLWGKGTRDAVELAEKYDADFEKILATMTLHKPNMTRGLTTQYNMNS